MNSKNALTDFLIYSYFKIVPEKLYKESEKDDYWSYCIKNIIMKAYEDATNQGAYNTLFNKEKLKEKYQTIKDASEDAKKEAAVFLFSQIVKLKFQTVEFDAWHKRTCEELMEKYSKVRFNNENFFTYGNAQKWVNMSMKYIWLLGLLPENIAETDLHIPIDSYIIDVLWKNQDIIFPLKLEDGVNRKKNYKTPSNYVIGWSIWDMENYKKFREKIDDEFTLERENSEWIQTAEKRRKNERQKKYDSFWN